MNPLIEDSARALVKLMRTRTGFLGLGPTYGQILIGTILTVAIERHHEKSVVRGAEQYLAEVDKYQKSF